MDAARSRAIAAARLLLEVHVRIIGHIEDHLVDGPAPELGVLGVPGISRLSLVTNLNPSSKAGGMCHTAVRTVSTISRK